MSQVLVLGSYVQDHCWSTDCLPRPGESRIGRFSTGPGGKGFNQAIAAHRLGVSTRFHGAIGDDALGQTARGFAAAENLPCEWSVTTQSTAASSIVVDAAGRNQICVALGANDALPPDAAQSLAPHMGAAGVLVVQLETALAPVRVALQLARAAGQTTLLNPAPINAEVDAELIALADLLTPNETEFEYLLQQQLGEAWTLDLQHFDEAACHALCRRLCPQGSVVVTLGEWGAFVSHPPDRLRGDARACYRVDPAQVLARDTTGAGDAFSGGLAAALLLYPHRPFAQQVSFACRVAGLSTERLGTAPAMPTLDEVNARFGEL
ncbi:MAG: ribokinase [Xanthomonadales bacterium]|nr:ribokinase [Xanthomonadales bacterium]